MVTIGWHFARADFACGMELSSHQSEHCSWHEQSRIVDRRRVSAIQNGGWVHANISDMPLCDTGWVHSNYRELSTGRFEFDDLKYAADWRLQTACSIWPTSVKLKFEHHWQFGSTEFSPDILIRAQRRNAIVLV